MAMVMESEAGRKQSRPRNALKGAKGRPQYSFLDSFFWLENQDHCQKD